MNEIVTKVIEPIKKNSRLLTIVLFFTVVGFNLLTYAGSLPARFFPVIGQLLSLFLVLILDVCVPVLMLIKQDKASKITFYFVFFLNYVSLIQYGFDSASSIVKGNTASYVTSCIFSFIATLLIITGTVFYIIGRLTNKDTFISIGLIILVSLFLLLLMKVIMIFIYYGKIKNTWTRWFYRFTYDFLYPLALFFGFIHFIYNEPLNPFEPKRIEEEGDEIVQEVVDPVEDLFNSFVNSIQDLRDDDNITDEE